MKKEDLYYDSRDNLHKIHAIKWSPDDPKDIKFVVQFVHGMAEYIDRYDEFARFLVSKGALVVGNDHLGHGKSVNNDDELGYFVKDNAKIVVVRDIHRLKKITQEAYPGIPYYILGHSMGSLILRNYLARYGNGIDGAIICGTASKSSLLTVSGVAFIKLLRIIKGDNYRSSFADSLVMGKPNARITNPKTKFDWLSKDEEVVRRYCEDKYCGCLFTINGYLTVAELVNELNKKKILNSIPKELPIAFFSGSDDPVGDYGKGVLRAVNQLKSIGVRTVSVKLYEGLRHELHNEIEREEFFNDVYEQLLQFNGDTRVREKYGL